jgi:glycosyltransferase involved in cell wall biosynthesis
MSGEPRIVFVIPQARFFLTHRLPLALAARAAGAEVHIATPAGAGVEAIQALGFPWHGVAIGSVRQDPFGPLRAVRDLLRIYRRVRPSLVHHVTLKAVVYGTLAARMTRVRAVVNAMPGLGDAFAGKRLQDRLWAFVTILLLRLIVRHRHMRLIVQNPDDVAQMRALRLVRADQLRMVRGSGVDPAVFLPAQRAPNDIPVVVYLGRIVYTKGLAELVAASRLLQQRGVRARIVFAGDLDHESDAGVDEATLGGWTEAGLIEYAGYHEDVASIYAMADIVCLPSYREGLPKTLLEAAACALPIVATDVPGCREVCRHEENGLLVPVRSVEPLADALQRLIEDEPLRRRLGARGRELIP